VVEVWMGWMCGSEVDGGKWCCCGSVSVSALDQDSHQFGYFLAKTHIEILSPLYPAALVCTFG
jgi:hypothetical protein